MLASTGPRCSWRSGWPAFAALLALGAVAAGPWAMEVLYGAGFQATRVDLALLALGIGGFLAAGTFCQALLAREQGGRAAALWSLAAVTFVSLQLVLPGSEFHAVSVAFAVASTLVAVTLMGSLWRIAPMTLLVHAVGARPNFVKMAPVVEALDRTGRFTQLIVHTGQHYDARMSDEVLADLSLPGAGLLPRRRVGQATASRRRRSSPRSRASFSTSTPMRSWSRAT